MKPLRKLNKYRFHLFAFWGICFILVSCVNPLRKGAWDPLPLKKSKSEITLFSDTNKTKTNKIK